MRNNAREQFSVGKCNFIKMRLFQGRVLIWIIFEGQVINQNWVDVPTFICKSKIISWWLDPFFWFCFKSCPSFLGPPSHRVHDSPSAGEALCAILVAGVPFQTPLFLVRHTKQRGIPLGIVPGAAVQEMPLPLQSVTSSASRCCLWEVLNHASILSLAG